MDSLANHILRELSYDGDLASNTRNEGCSVSRLEDFIRDFYHNNSTQTIDDAYCAFIWSMLVQEPTVRVGVLPPGNHTEVYIAPQTSAQRKAKKRGEEVVDEPVAALTVVADAPNRTLEDLKQNYGDTLRIAVDPETSFTAITGSHIRPSKLTPMVYTALQLITRGREQGISVVELGRKTRYDQKTCFYVVQQLEKLDLVVKIRRAGVGTHFCMHKHFYERSGFWQTIRDEEAAEKAKAARQEEKMVVDTQPGSKAMEFDPIDSRHLSSLPLVRGRLVKLLNNSTNQMHVSQNLLIRLGFANPSKTDRRFFSIRLGELVKEGTIEKVLVPSRNKERTTSGKVQCVRLVNRDEQCDKDKEGIVVLPADTAEDEEVEEEDAELLVDSHLKTNVVIHKQIIDLLDNSDTRGMTLTELSRQLCNFDRRTIELLLQRLDKDPPPPHLIDLGIAVVTETHGRERRHRYYTYRGYRSLLSRENLEDDGAYSSADIAQAGGFFQVSANEFWTTEAQLFKYQDNFRDQDPKMRGKKALYKNPIMPDGSVKKGRPRKDGTTQTGREKKRKKVEEKDEFNGGGELPEPPPKRRKTEGSDPITGATEEGGSAVAPRRRGRPPKAIANPADPQSTPRKRGRPATKRQDPPPANETLQEHSAKSTQQSVVPDTAEIAQLVPFQQSPLEDKQQLDHPSTVTDHSQNLELSRAVSPVAAPIQGAIVGNIDAEPPAPTEGSNNEVNLGEIITLDKQPPNPGFSHEMGSENQTPAMQNLTAINSSGKRPHDDLLAEQPAVKRLRLRGKTNVSHLRRENELLRVIQDCGGIAVVNAKEFLDAHMTLLEKLAIAGESASAPPGTRLDRRTVDAGMQMLQSDGRIRVLKTTHVTQTGSARPVTIAHVHDLNQEKITAFVTELSKNNPFGYVPPKVKHLDEEVEYASAKFTRTSTITTPPKVSQVAGASQGDVEKWAKNVPGATKLFGCDDTTIHDVLQRENPTISQMYGYLLGRTARARLLHLVALEIFQKNLQSEGIVSQENRILHLTCLLRDISIASYCALVPTLAIMDELDDLMRTVEGRNTLLKNLPNRVYDGLGVGGSRSRSRILDLLDTLRSLGLVVSIHPSNSDAPQYTCATTGDHPAGYDIISGESWFSTSSGTAPVYWKLADQAPIFLWASSLPAAPLWKNVPVMSHKEGVAYWEDLHRACFDTDLAQSHTSSGIDISAETTSIMRSLRRKSSWRSTYNFSWYQERYLRQFLVANPLLDEDGGDARLKHIGWVVSAPEPVVRQFYADSQQRMTAELEKARRRIARAKQPAAVAEGKRSLAKKAAEIKKQRQQDWDKIVIQLHPGPMNKSLLSRVKPIRDQYLKAVSIKEPQNWEKEISGAIREANLVAKKPLKPSKPKLAPLPPVPFSSAPLAVINSAERSVEELVAAQGLLQKPPPPKKRKKPEEKKDEEGEKHITKRRGRFSWNKDYDELAKDTAAIIKARCRSGQRMEWAAAEQAFPSLPRNSVRQRVDRLCKDPAVESYLHRLEERWYELWTQHRGTALLPDPEPLSVTNFDLVHHLKFLRAHVDKASIRAGFSQADIRPAFVLPPTIDQLLADHDVIEKTPTAPPWDFAWNTITEEGREKQMFLEAFTLDEEHLPPAQNYESEDLHVAEAAVKLVLGTPNESYDLETGAALLRLIGEQSVSTTTINLLNRGVLTRVVRDVQKPKPGRTLKISEINMNAIGGNLPREIFQDASSLEELAMEEQSVEDEWREWPLLASDGDMAALIEMVSEDKVDFVLDITKAQAARPAIEWNSKKADDDDIETGIQIQIHDIAWVDMWPGQASSADDTSLRSQAQLSPGDSVHGLTCTDQPACCKLHSAGLVDCEACLDNQLSTFISSLKDPEVDLASALMKTLKNAGPAGITKAAIMPRVQSSDGSNIFKLIEKMTKTPVPLMFWTGYISLVLVSAYHLQPWTITINEDPVTRLMPRRWLSVRGTRITDVWEAALRAVVGIIIFRPGITQSELRWRLRSVYDRPEVNEVLRYLETESFIVKRSETRAHFTGCGSLDDREEMETLWFLGNRHWYHV